MAFRTKVSKLLLFIFNLSFLLGGITLTGFGITSYLATKALSSFVDQNAIAEERHYDYIVIGIGSAMIAISVLGACGEIRENFSMMVLYAIFLTLALPAHVYLLILTKSKLRTQANPKKEQVVIVSMISAGADIILLIISICLAIMFWIKAKRRRSLETCQCQVTSNPSRLLPFG